MKKTLIFAALVAALCSCSNEQVTNPASPQGDAILGLNGSVGTISTKAESIFLPKGTTVGVFAWQSEAYGTAPDPVFPATTLITTPLANVLYFVNDELGKFTSDAFIQLKSLRKYNASAYAPHKTGLPIALPNVSFVHQEDVLYAPASPVDFTTVGDKVTGKTDLNFVHKMAQIKLRLLSGTGTPSLDNVSVKISGFYDSCTMDLTNGTIVPSSGHTAATSQIQKLTGSDASALTPFCIVPGSLVLAIEISAGGVLYKMTTPSKTFNASESTELVLKLNKVDASLEVTGKVVDWTPVEVMNFEVPSSN